MARDFRRNSLETRCLVVNSLSSGVHWSPLESSPVLETCWRRPTGAIASHTGTGRAIQRAGPGAGGGNTNTWQQREFSLAGRAAADRTSPGPAVVNPGSAG